jgi:hypothetical protein
MLSELSIQYRVFKKAVQKIELKDRHLRRLMVSPIALGETVSLFQMCYLGFLSTLVWQANLLIDYLIKAYPTETK